MNIKTDATSSALAKRKEKKDKERKELDELALDEIFAFQASVQDAWQQNRQITANNQQQNQQQEEAKPQELTKKDAIVQVNSPHLQAAQQSFEQMQDQQIRQQLKKQLLRDYELGEHVFQIDVQSLGKINVTAQIQEDAWQFSLNAENPNTQNWLAQQRETLQQGFSAEKSQIGSVRQTPKNINLQVI
jgi:hypothetical protein